MKFNDPFNRLISRQQSEYNSFCKILKKNQIENLSDATHLSNKINTRTLYFTLFTLGLSVIIIFFLPDYKLMVIIIAALALSWILSNSLRGKMYLQRYIDEELCDD